MIILDQLAIQWGTDKSSLTHDYCRHYQRFFEDMRLDATKILEIGIAGGHSLKMWLSYFPNATIFGIDHNQEAVKGVSGYNAFLQPILGEASDPEFWDHFQSCWGEDFGVIIDDGSHAVWATWVAFKKAWPLVRPGGFYCIEDIHAGFDDAYRRDNVANGLPAFWTVHDFLCDIARERVHENGAFQIGKPTTVADIEFLHLSKSLAIIKKRARK